PPRVRTRTMLYARPEAGSRRGNCRSSVISSLVPGTAAAACGAMMLESRARRWADSVLIFHLESQNNTFSANWICRDGRAVDEIVPTPVAPMVLAGILNCG